MSATSTSKVNINFLEYDRERQEFLKERDHNLKWTQMRALEKRHLN